MLFTVVWVLMSKVVHFLDHLHVRLLSTLLPRLCIAVFQSSGSLSLYRVAFRRKLWVTFMTIKKGIFKLLEHRLEAF
jgi:hypothetical protein